jgi:hypothetical protein
MGTPQNEKQDRMEVPAAVAALTRALAEPFEPSEVKFKPAVVSGSRAMALAYVDARVIQDRLDEVLGVEGWSDDYECLPDGSVVCRLRLRLGEEWVTKVDVGGPSEQQDGGDRMKAAFSDALKRAAVKFGVGRYLYRLPAQWVDYDPHKRQFVRPPALPAFALPKKKVEKKGADKKQPDAPALKEAPPQPAVVPALAAKKGRSVGKAGPHGLPANGAELQRRLYDYDAKLAAQGLCARGALVKHVALAGSKAGYDADLASWSGPAITLAVEETKAFEAQLRQQGKQKEVA